MEIYTLPASKEIEHCVRKIAIFRSGEYSSFRQKLTPSPYCCLTYNHYNIPDLAVNNEIFKSDQRLQVTGPKTLDDIYAAHNGKLSQVLIEFTASGFYCFFRRTPADYLNTTVALTNLMDGSNTGMLSDDLSKTDDPNEHAALIQQFMASMNILKSHKYAYLATAIRLIEESNGNISVSTVCGRINISERQLNRKFIEITGLKPLQFIKLKQLHYIINLLHSEQFSSLKELAYQMGFYDPAHFNHHFKKLTGMSPGNFLESDEHVAFRYYNDLLKD
jgi:AraC-like DNA-binding protein